MESYGSFGWLNWITLFALLIGTTFIGHRLRGKQTDLRGFFLGNKSVPWWAVSGSLTATRTSALTFIAIPAAVFMKGGNLAFIQAMAGFMIGDFLMAFFIIKLFYDEEIFSPYEYIEKRLGTSITHLCRGFWAVGAILSQSVRLLATALVLNIITGLSLLTCILLMCIFSVVWSIMGGITTVIWTDVIQFCIFITGAFFAIFWALNSIPGGLNEMFAIADAQSKLKALDFTFNPQAIYTFWIGLFAAPVFVLSQLSIDQTFIQRVLCCRNAGDAKKSIFYAAFTTNVTTPIMMFVGLCLVAFYYLYPVSTDVASMFDKQPDRVFPYYLVTQIPVGISGLIIASIFAAGISTLDSALTALSEVTVNGFYRRYVKQEASEKHYLKASKLFVAFWGIVCSSAAWSFHFIASKGLLALGLGAYAYVYGTIFGIAILAYIKRGSLAGILMGVVFSVAAVVYMKILNIAFFWWYPVATLIQVGIPLLISKGKNLK